MGSRVRVACRVRPLVEGGADGEGGEGVGVNSETNSGVFSAQAGGLSVQTLLLLSSSLFFSEHNHG